MKFDSFTALVAISTAFLGTSAGPVVAKRQGSSTISGTSSSSSSSSPTPTTSSSSKDQVSEGLVPITLSDGTVTTTAVRDPQFTPTASTSSDTTSYTYSRTGLPVPVSTNFPQCHDTGAKPFCLPNNNTPVYVGKTYYATWNPDFFPVNSTVQIKIQWANDSNVETWSSENILNQLGYAAVNMEKDWLQGYSMYNLSFRALNFVSSDPKMKAEVFDGPMVTLGYAPPQHRPPPPPTKFNKEGLIIGLPVTLGCVLLVVFGLYIGMRKNRTIGLGNVMGRRRGYGTGKSKRQRLGLGKKGAIRLEDREPPRSQYANARGHSHGDSLGSLVSDDGRPTPGTNHFRDEIHRQQTGR
ncbi:hypothetical protein DM02DRAFT_55132 [Periconia macrospinosa]|uniref:Uncharacterized protein n=1 Tax=Periconia macrospinosa TaxID=97972 RepID=A0A2V1E6G4_9PLEO|nr:hypothetical protein DM02DRAFT_55132 [Periconia macrospinosa]